MRNNIKCANLTELFPDDRSEEEKNLQSQSLYQSINKILQTNLCEMTENSKVNRIRCSLPLREKNANQMLYAALDSLIRFVLHNCL